MMRTTKLCACCLDVLIVKDVADDRILSIHPSISLLYTVKREETNVYMSFGWQTLPFLLSSPPSSLSFAILSIEQGLRHETCVRRYPIQQCMLLSSKTLSAISAFCLTSYLVFFSYIQINRVSTYCSFSSRQWKWSSHELMMMMLSRRIESYLLVVKTCTYI
jgi:hypothetical protein